MKDIKELMILNHLLVNSEFQVKVLPYLQENYFSSQIYKLLFATIKDYISQYKSAPSREALIICLKPKIKNLSDEDLEEVSVILDEDLYKTDSPQNLEWLLNTTEEFCKERAVYNSLLKSIEIHQGLEKGVSKEVIPDLLKDALAISFDTKIGLDYLEDTREQFEFYTRQESGIPFDIPILNKITNNIGLPKKALTVLISPTGGAKSLSKCHFAASAIKQGFNVVYFSMEMSAERISQRIDANLLDVVHNDIPMLTEKDYFDKVNKLKKFVKGKLFVKEFPTGVATAGHFRHVLEELKRKKGVKIDLVIVDYLNICMSSRYKPGGGNNSYSILKSVTEEIRGIAMEYDCAVVSSTQVNRPNLTNQNMEMDAISDSIGISFTADIILSLFRNEALDAANRVLVTQLKNRYNDINNNKKFMIGLEREKMRLYSVTDQENETSVFLGKGSTDEGPTPDITYDHFKGRSSSVSSPKSFSDFKF